MEEKSKNSRIACPYCGGEGIIYHKTWVKVLYPVLLFDKKYRCLTCREFFNNPLKQGVPLLKKKSKLTDKVLKGAVIVFFIWIFYSFISAMI